MVVNQRIKSYSIILLLIAISIFNRQVIPEFIYNQKNDAIVRLSSSSYYLDWTDVWGGLEADYGRGGIVVDDYGYIYIAGYTFNFGSGRYDIFIIKYNTNGTKIWTRFWGTSTDEFANDITLDASGDIYITGHQGSSGYDMLLLKYDSNGNYQWHSTWGPETFNEGNGVVVNTSGDIYIAGRAGGELAFLKYNSAGNLVWSKINTSLLVGDDIGIDEAGFFYICGRNKASSNKYLSKFNSNGGLIWNHFWGSDVLSVCDMALDDSSNFYFTGNIEVNGGSNTDAYIVKLTSSGSKLWSVNWGTPLNEIGYGICLDDFGNIYLTGEVNSPEKKRDAFIAKFDPYGVQLWDDTWGGGSEYEHGDRTSKV